MTSLPTCRWKQIALTALLISVPAQIVATESRESHLLRLKLSLGTTYTSKTQSETVVEFSGDAQPVLHVADYNVQTVIGVQGAQGHHFLHRASYFEDYIEFDQKKSLRTALMLHPHLGFGDVSAKGQLDERGRVSDYKVVRTNNGVTNGLEFGDISQTGLFGFQYPEHAVKPGDRWMVKMDAVKTFQALSRRERVTKDHEAYVQCELLEFLPFQKSRHAKVRYFSILKGTIDPFTTQSMKISNIVEGTVWIEVSTGIPTRFESDSASTIYYSSHAMEIRTKSVTTVSSHKIPID